MTYSIRDWDRYFENNRTRELKELKFVIIPNKQDGDGYTELLDHPNGAAHFGAWCSMIQVASKCEPRGVLVRDGKKPHDSASLSRMTRIPKPVFDEALPRLKSIGWIEESHTGEQESLFIQEDSLTLGSESQEDAGNRAAYRRGEEGIEEDRKEEKKEAHAAKPRTPSKVKTCDKDYLNELQADEAYQRLNVQLIHAKMVRWCKEKGKVPTRARLVNWLNREDQPMDANSNGHSNQRPNWMASAK